MSIDPIQRCLSYEIVENNWGFTYYVVEIKVNEVDDGGCMIEWSFEADPIEGWRLEDLCRDIESSLKDHISRVSEEVQEGKCKFLRVSALPEPSNIPWAIPLYNSLSVTVAFEPSDLKFNIM